MITENEILHLYERVTEYNALVRYYNRVRRQNCDAKGNYVGPLKLTIVEEMTAGAGDMKHRVTESVRACLMAHMLAVIDEAYKNIEHVALEWHVDIMHRLELENVEDGNSED